MSTALLAAGRQSVITTMHGHPVAVALAIARQKFMIAKSSASTEVTRPAGALIKVWSPSITIT